MISSEPKSIRLNAIHLNSNVTSLQIPLQIPINGKTKTFKALIDTGAQAEFIDYNLAKRLRLPTQKLTQPIRVTNVDGTPNKMGQLTDKCLLKIKEPYKYQGYFYLTKLSQEDVILGLPWYKKVKPKITFDDDKTITINKIKIHPPKT